ncbi:MAG: S-adenosylmethionine:tRNA ribosyltransferase-isomerase, partial [Bacteroidales bacterium]|nr:S-adenosylmethionine:tRNA ribosyltransferase-isomerase [Bacteroidales bacterium]
FVPVKTQTIGDHQMHAETVIIEKSVIFDLLNTSPDKLTVVGTTSLRSLESLFWLGQKISMEPDTNVNNLCVNQWDPYSYDQVIQIKESLSAILNYIEQNQLEEIRFFTRLIIVPGYQFKLVNRLITNFHQPSSTLLLLVSALIGDSWRQVYDYALDNDFRFLSYGDSSLLEMHPNQHG